MDLQKRCRRLVNRDSVAKALIGLILFDATFACFPGTAKFKLRRARKEPPLIYKEHDPNIHETSAIASGPREGRIRRSDPRFKTLVVNHNADIVFKDEEGTGEDHVMTRRCKEKLDNLAMLVVSYWPGVKLRVTEAWDEDGYHPPDSLHYEGRAVDIGTSDKDRSKYGMLARLARQAGFDWVYYESKAHIHVSCKTDNALGIKLRGCFHGDARVRTESGEHKPIRSLAVGDRILTALPNGTVAFSPVVLFLDRSPALVLDYLQFSLIDGASLTTTPYHLIYASDDCRDLTLPTIASTIWTFRDTFQPIYAKDVRRGDCILRLSEATNDIFMNKSDLALNRLIPLRVQQVRTLQKKGAFAPLTLAGNIFVDDVLASCYAGHNSESVAHFALFPARLYFVVKDWTLSQLQKCCTTLFDGFLSSDARQEMTEGIHPYARLLIWMRDLLAL